jgi:hypothetical protein
VNNIIRLPGYDSYFLLMIIKIVNEHSYLNNIIDFVIVETKGSIFIFLYRVYQIKKQKQT